MTEAEVQWWLSASPLPMPSPEWAEPGDVWPVDHCMHDELVEQLGLRHCPECGRILTWSLVAKGWGRA